MKKEKVLGCFAIIVILMSLIIGISSISFDGSKDENIKKYKMTLKESINGNIHHYTLVNRVSNVDGEFLDEYYVEEYKLGKETLRIDVSSSSEGEYHEFRYGGNTYDYSTSPEFVSVNKHPEMRTIAATPHEVGPIYYSIKDKNVIYEETEENWIVTYDNQSMIGRPISGIHKEKSKGGYTSSISVAYFDKEWNLEKLEITEKWISITKDGKEYERVKETFVTYHATTEDEIKKVFESEYRMLEDLLKDS